MATLNVGAGQAYATLSAAVAASRDGDVIAVQAGTYVNDFATISKDITIVGVGGMANFVATVAPPNGKAILVTQSDVTIQNLSFSGAAVADQNGAGIRYEGGNLVVIDSYFHDNQMGLLANGDPNGTIRIVGSEFADSLGGGGDGLRHNLYIGNIASLVVDDSYFHDAYDGHQIKSRAQSTTITNSRIYDGTGAGSYSIDLPNGGVGVIRNNVIQQGPNSDNPGIIHYGGESDAYAGSSLLIEDNVVVNDMSSSGARLLYNVTTLTSTVRDNAVYGLTASQIALGSATVSGTTLLSTRPTLDTSSGGGGGSPSGPTTPIETLGATDLDQVANKFFLHDSAGNGPSLKYAGSDVVAGQFGAWTPLGAEKIGSGYQVVWANGNADQYIVWNVDSSGNWKSQSGVVSGSAYALQSLEAPFQQDFNHDGTTGFATTPIETAGATDLDRAANAFFLHDSAGNGPSLKYAGSDVVAGQFGAWTPLGVEKIGSGYQVVWENGNADQYIVWDVDSSGNWKSQSAVVSGSSYAVQSLEATFQQDFNHDGTTGFATTPIETSGVTDLDRSANAFFLHDSAGNGPSLKYAGSDVVAGQFGAWTPLGAEKVGSSYQVVWKNGSADQYIVWNVDNNGNWKSQSGVVTGSSYALQSQEATLQQDFNADGTTGLKTTTIETAGATHLDQVANELFLRDGAGNGPSLKYTGSDVVVGQFGAWTPLGAEKTASGYQVAWQNGAADQYVIWNVDNNGNWKSQSAVVSGASPALEAMESILHQDLNHDSVIG